MANEPINEWAATNNDGDNQEGEILVAKNCAAKCCNDAWRSENIADAATL